MSGILEPNDPEDLSEILRIRSGLSMAWIFLAEINRLLSLYQENVASVTRGFRSRLASLAW
jgi:hypothetical protein